MAISAALSYPITGASEGRSRVEIAFDGAERYLTYTIPVRVGAIFDVSPSATIDGITYALTGDDDLTGSDLTVVERSVLAAGMPPLRDIDGDNHLDAPVDTSNPYFQFDASKCIVCSRSDASSVTAPMRRREKLV